MGTGPTILRKKIEELSVLRAFVVAVLRFSITRSPDAADDNGEREVPVDDEGFLVGAMAAEAVLRAA
jgi:hypothetical protein